MSLFQLITDVNYVMYPFGGDPGVAATRYLQPCNTSTVSTNSNTALGPDDQVISLYDHVKAAVAWSITTVSFGFDIYKNGILDQSFTSIGTQFNASPINLISVTAGDTLAIATTSDTGPATINLYLL